MRRLYLVAASCSAIVGIAGISVVVVKRRSAEAKRRLVEELCRAAGEGELKRVKAILDVQPELVNARSKLSLRGYTPLHWAACSLRRKKAELMVGLLLDYKPDINARSPRGRTPVHLQTIRYNIGAVKLLLEAGADPNIADNKGCAPLHWVVNMGHVVEMLDLLLAHGADVNAQNKEGQALLHLAARYGRRDIVQFLLARNADPCLKDASGLLPLQLAEEKGEMDIVELLRGRGAKR